jgi:hypothetical protein
MNTHPWIGLGASAGAIHGLVLAVGVETVALTESDGHASTVPLHRLRLDDPAEARRRLEAAGAPVDYEAIGRGAVREAIAAMSGPGGIAVGSVYQGLAEAAGRGVVAALARGVGGVSDYLSFPGIVRLIGESIGKGIGSARGGGS